MSNKGAGWGAWILRLPIQAYRLLLSPLLPASCRFQPTCSAYGLEALKRHGAWRGMGLTLKRLARCHPWGDSGYDPVPESLAVDIKAKMPDSHHSRFC